MNLLRPYRLLIVLGSCVAAVANAAAPSGVDKGGFQYAQVPPWPSETLDFAPLTAQVASAASKHCGSTLAAAPMALGAPPVVTEPDSSGKGAAGKLVRGLFGSPGGRSRPKLAKDPVGKKRKQSFKHPLRKAELQLGGVLVGDALVLGARVARAPDKNSFHTVFIEQPDCSRLWPQAYEGYGLWGSWKLSVAVTKTTSTYRNGALQSRTIDRSGFTRNGRFNPASGFSIFSDARADDEHTRLLNPQRAFLQQLRVSAGIPAWIQLGYSEPVGGIRHAGARFAVGERGLAPGSIAVVHLAEQQRGVYSTIGFAAAIAIEDGAVRFTTLPEPAAMN